MVLGEMKVERIHEGNVSRVHPPYDPSWSVLTRLRWEAAVANLEIAPLRIVVESGIGDHRVNGVTDTASAYRVYIPRSRWGYSAMSELWATAFIRYVSQGIQIERDLHEQQCQEATPIFDRLVARFAIERGHAG